MLYFLYEFAGINIFQYITVRASFAFLLSFIFTLYLFPKFINWAKRKNVSQPIFALAPDSHQGKSNTPTMGGLVFLFSAIFASLLTIKLHNMYAVGAILSLVLFGAIGIKDDISKIVGKSNSSGLSARAKFLAQILSALLIGVFLIFVADFNTDFFVPFYKYPVLHLGLTSLVLWVLVIVASSNAVNLTDGLDGLATVPSILGILTLSIFIYLSGHAIFSEYLLLPNIKGLGESAIVGVAMIGALIGFLWYNCHPAEVFMGDSGSLSIGAFLGYLAIVSKNEILLILIGFVFVIETLSVILQVGSFKMRKKRIFHMAPLHHHFELKGWMENKIIVRFWIIALIANLLAIASIKIR